MTRTAYFELGTNGKTKKNTVGYYGAKGCSLQITEMNLGEGAYIEGRGRLVKFRFERDNNVHEFIRYFSNGLQGACYYLKKRRGDRFTKELGYEGTPVRVLDTVNGICYMGHMGKYRYYFDRGE